MEAGLNSRVCLQPLQPALLEPPTPFSEAMQHLPRSWLAHNTVPLSGLSSKSVIPQSAASPGGKVRNDDVSRSRLETWSSLPRQATISSVLFGLKTLFGELARPLCISIELHPFLLPLCSRTSLFLPHPLSFCSTVTSYQPLVCLPLCLEFMHFGGRW